jgi:hypothetical protein
MAAGLVCTSLQAGELRLSFRSIEPRFDQATQAYRDIWDRDGARILETLNRIAGETAFDESIDVLVFEGVSESGRRGGPMRLRASYPEAVKRATLVHELLHRYVDRLDGVAACYTEVHDLMSLMLIDAWSDLWGDPFVFEQAAVESKRSERYRASWARALALSKVERQAELARILACRVDPSR